MKRSLDIIVQLYLELRAASCRHERTSDPARTDFYDLKFNIIKSRLHKIFIMNQLYLSPIYVVLVVFMAFHFDVADLHISFFYDLHNKESNSLIRSHKFLLPNASDRNVIAMRHRSIQVKTPNANFK